MPQNECQVCTSEHNAPSDDIMGFLSCLLDEEPTKVAANPPTLHNKTHNKTKRGSYSCTINLSTLEKKERARMQNRQHNRKHREEMKRKVALVPVFETRLAVLEEQIAEAAASLQKKDSELAHEKAQVRQLEVKVQQLEAQVREEQKAKKAKSLF